jgi:hypothetical protein
MATACEAVGSNSNQGVVVPISRGTSGTAQAVPGTSNLSGVACPRASTCYGVGYGFNSDFSSVEGVVVPITDGVPRTAQAVSAPATVLQGVACPNATTCEAVGVNEVNFLFHGVVVPISEGTPGTSQAVSGTAKLYGVACASAITCEAVGFNSSVQGVLVTVTDVPPTPRALGRSTW